MLKEERKSELSSLQSNSDPTYISYSETVHGPPRLHFVRKRDIDILPFFEFLILYFVPIDHEGGPTYHG